MTLSEDQQRFLDAWVSMASLFSFSPSTARVCALLLCHPAPLSPTEIAAALGISRGNVSMCLKELRGWGVVKRVPSPGDRRDYYACRGDLFEQMLAIARERKRREFDPAVDTALDALRGIRADAPPEHTDPLDSVAGYLEMLARVGREVLDDEVASRALLALMRRMFGSGRAEGDAS